MDETGAGFAAQMSFLAARYEQLQTLEAGPASHKTIVCDYIFEKDKLFACINLNDEELAVYNRYYSIFRDRSDTPTAIWARGGIGRRAGFRFLSWRQGGGSTPPAPTMGARACLPK